MSVGPAQTLSPADANGSPTRTSTGTDPQPSLQTPLVAGPAPLGTLRAQKYAEEPAPHASMYPDMHELMRPHLDSFNALFDARENMLALAVAGLDRREVRDALGNRLTFALEDVCLAPPLVSDRDGGRRVGQPILPHECRERGISYRGQLTGRIVWQVNGGQVYEERRPLGYLPIMVRSARCHLQGLGAAELVARKEDADELGGYFIVNGIERLVRLLIATRRNHPMALVRSSFAKRGPLYTSYGVQIRSVREDQSSQTIYLQYLSDGSCMLRFSYRKNEYLVPALLIMRALTGATDQDIMEAVVQGDWENTFVVGRVEAMLREFKRTASLYTQDACLAYLGSRFHIVLNHLPKETSFVEVGRELLRRIVLVHLEASEDKANLLVLMIRKLYALVAGTCAPDNPDSPMHQEVLLSGQLIGAYLKEKLDDVLASVQIAIATDLRRQPAAVTFADRDCAYFRKTLQRCNSDVGKRIEYFLATGNLVSATGLDLQQTSGYTVVAERLNFLRFLAHFRSVHRGAFFAELKTTTVRKLMPEAWGFFCPVHTPDGAPCGLLNHLTHVCRLPHALPAHTAAQTLLSTVLALEVVPLERPAHRRDPQLLPVVVDGRWIGLVAPGETLERVATQLRHLRATASGAMPPLTEIVAVPVSRGGLYPGLYIWTTPSRLMRPVSYLSGADGTVPVRDCIGSFEQVYLDIAVRAEETVPGVHRYCEEAMTNIFSVVANMTPFCDFNQSPRNMYQCQMAKQSMGTPTHSWTHRTDNKLYRLQNGQRPLVRPRLYSRYGLDDYPNGTNAVVAVISYTGYDMEDAMILNKSAFERGFKHGSIYKTDFIDISDRDVRGEGKTHRFGITLGPGTSIGGNVKGLDPDGLPQPGTIIKPDDPLFAVVDEATGTVKVERFKAFEPAIVDQVRLIGGGGADGSSSASGPCQRVCIKFRVPRNPVIGDKFASRAGQKGVCSQKYPIIDLPFTESGMAPDIIINPHAFPSRMTIGMFVESMAAKAGAMHGFAQDASAFQFSESESAADYFGEQLRTAGFNYYGNEPMYSGISGQELRVDIYIGLVYYQRLRHMVSDKFQVRTTGPVHNLTQQPVKGRKRAGGIRLGEMERDSLLAHGVAFTLQDRLMNCSDYSKALVCTCCGSILSPVPAPETGGFSFQSAARCQSCASGPDAIQTIALPFVFRYLASELMAMNINMRLEVD
jgi:DNA-directed RNA polymerase I subunit RPA2